MKKQVFKWKQNARVSVAPEVAAQELARIAEKVALTPEAVVKEARKKRNPLHHYFEWDDSLAAEHYRCEQARYMIRSLEVTIVPNAKQPEKTLTVRSYLSVGSGIEDGKDSQFHSIEAVVSDSELRDQVLRKIWNRLLALKQQYQHLTELKAVWEAIDKAQEKVLSAS